MSSTVQIPQTQDELVNMLVNICEHFIQTGGADQLQAILEGQLDTAQQTALAEAKVNEVTKADIGEALKKLGQSLRVIRCVNKSTCP